MHFSFGAGAGSVGDLVGAAKGAAVGGGAANEASVGGGVPVFSAASTGGGDGDAEGAADGFEPISTALLSVSTRFCVLKSMFGVPSPGPMTAPEIPSDSIAAFTWDGFMLGFCSKYKAATPAACCIQQKSIIE